MSLSLNYPTISPSLLLDFANSGRLDPRVTFTRSSTATFFDETGVLRTANNDVPRFDYNPATLAAQGLLIEESRTNIQLQSEDLSSATGWGATGSTISVNATAAPTGATTADKLVEDSSTGSHQVASVNAVTAGTTYAFSFLAKAAERTRLVVSGMGLASAGLIPVFTLTGSGSVTGGPSGTSITLINNGWYKCVIPFAPTNTTPPIYLLDNGTGTSYTGDGTSGLFIWGAQTEAGAFPTSYIPTTTTALTRAADVASVNTLSPWFNAAEGTLFAEASSTGYVLDTGFPLVVSLDDGTNNNRITIQQGAAATGLTLNARTASVSTTIADSNVDLSSTPAKIAGAYFGTTVIISVNGSAAITGTSNGVPSGLTNMKLGSAVAGYLSGLNGHLRRITYYPRKLSSAELQAITA
jgi:hypothetical protein